MSLAYMGQRMTKLAQLILFFLLVNFFCDLECVGPSFAFVIFFVLLRDVWIRTQRAAVASWRATN
jgi:hypothetical protein